MGEIFSVKDQNKVLYSDQISYNFVLVNCY